MIIQYLCYSPPPPAEATRDTPNGTPPHRMIPPCRAIQWICRFLLHFNRMKSAKTDRILRAAMGLLMVALVYVIYAAIHERVVVAGDAAPEFSVRAENGQTVSLPNFGGKVLILNFWEAGARPACRRPRRSARLPPSMPVRAWLSSASASIRTRRPIRVPAEVPPGISHRPRTPDS